MTALALVRRAEPDHLDVVPVRRAAPARIDAAPQDLPASLHVLTCGSVDDGKSTLIGRLLWDTSGLPSDQRMRLEQAPKTAAGTPDFSLLVDGLVAEREQGITIDIAWRYLDTPSRRLVIIDSPGHEQYTRNMATGASHADVAILLVDARDGVKEQTLRHAAILDLMGVTRVVLAVNKMDLVGWSAERFATIRKEFLELAARFGFADATAIPVSAVLGDNVARSSQVMPWYDGAPLLTHLLRTPSRRVAADRPFRLPVQLIVRAGQDFRGLAGTVSSGSISVGDEVIEPVTGRRAHVKRIATMGRDLASAVQSQAVVLQLDRDIDVSRGATLAVPGSEPAVTEGIDARLVWLAEDAFARERGYVLRTATDTIPITGITVTEQLDLATLRTRKASGAGTNDIVTARIDLGRRAAIDLFADQPESGSFMLVDPMTGASVAGGVVVGIRTTKRKQRDGTFTLTRGLIERGIGADLAPSPGSEDELRRRANEVAILLREAGVTVEIEATWGRGGIDAATIGFGAATLFSFAYLGAVLFGLI